MTTHLQRGTISAWALGLVAVVLYAVGLVLVVGQLRDPAIPTFEFWIEGVFSAPVLLAVALVLIARRPDHRISQLFAALVVAGSLQTTTGAAATTLLHTGSLQTGARLAWAHDLAQMALVLALILIVFLFPTGRLPSRRWGPVGWLVVAGGLVVMGAIALRPGPLGNFPAVMNPFAADLVWLTTLHDLGTWAMVAGFAGVAVAPFARFRRARGPEREQLKWFAFAAVTGAFALAVVGPLLLEGELAGALLWTIAPTGVVAVLGLTVLRYRLYDIDRVVSRTVSYALVAALLGGVFAGGVLVLQGLLPFQSDLAVAASTLAVAALFNPLRRRVQDAVDRRFNRARYDAQQTVDAFAGRLRDAVDLKELQAELVGVVEGTVEPAHLSVWLRPTGEAHR